MRETKFSGALALTVVVLMILASGVVHWHGKRGTHHDHSVQVSDRGQRP